MIASMTGFGSASASRPPHTLTVEVASVNRRNLEVTTSAPREWQALEARVNELARQHFARGKINVSVRVDDERGQGLASWDEAAVADMLANLRRTAEKAGIAFEPSADAVLRLALSASNAAGAPALEDLRETVEAALIEAFNALAAMRRDEGQSLSADLLARIALLREHHKQIAAFAPETVKRYRELLFQRLEQAGLEIDLEDDRVLREIALFADRCDISEELTRIASHLDQMAECLEAREAVGRKLDFLCQELHREINTVGSKAGNIGVSRLVVEAKNELERLREQVQNVE